MNKANLIYGFHSITPLLWQDGQSIDKIYLEDKRRDKRVQEVLELVQERGITLEMVTGQYLERLCGSNKHQGIVAQLNTAPAANKTTLKELLTELDQRETATIVVLDGITDPHNLGAIIRSCDCFGVDAIILPKDNSASINATVAKVSSGAINHLPVLVVNNLARTLDEIKEYGFWIAGTTLADRSVSLFDFKPDNKMVWVMGSEGDGIRRLVAESCDYLVSIPMFGSTQSLNVSVATGVVLSHARYLQVAPTKAIS